MKPNTAGQFIGAQMVTAADGSAFTSAVTCYVTGNNGTQAVGSVGSGACTHKGNGYHSYAPAQAETNYAHVAFTFTGSGAVPATVQVYPRLGDAELVDAVWDEILTGATHNIAGSAGRRLRELGGSIVTTGTAQGGTLTSITLSSAASSVNNTYDPGMVQVVAGTGAGQARMIIQYVGSTRVASVDRDWRTAPDNTSEYEIFAATNLISTNEGLAQGATATTLTLNAVASAIDDVYAGQLLVMRTGTGQDQTRMIVAYNGTTKVATFQIPWVVQPVAGSGYIIWPVGRAALVAFGPGIIDQIQAGLATSAEVAAGASSGVAATAAVEVKVDAVKSKTDQLAFGVANAVNANITHVNEILVNGTGAPGTEWGP